MLIVVWASDLSEKGKKVHYPIGLKGGAKTSKETEEEQRVVVCATHLSPFDTSTSSQKRRSLLTITNY